MYWVSIFVNLFASECNGFLSGFKGSLDIPECEGRSCSARRHRQHQGERGAVYANAAFPTNVGS